MKQILFYLVLVILVACGLGSQMKDEKEITTTEYKVILHGTEEFPLFVQTSEGKLKIHAPTVAPNSAPLEMNPQEGDSKIRYGQVDDNGNLWKFGPTDITTVHGISFAPYYSIYAYNVLQALKQTGSDQLYPPCDVDTQFLIIFFMSKKQYPMAGCVK